MEYRAPDHLQSLRRESLRSHPGSIVRADSPGQQALEAHCQLSFKQQTGKCPCQETNCQQLNILITRYVGVYNHAYV